jgi:hypothetical protein
MRALAWDDQPGSYIKDLADELRAFGIEVTICPTEREFHQEFRAPDRRWDFVITDLVTGNEPAVSEQHAKTGAQIAQRAALAGLPVFMVTQHYTRFDPVALGIPPQVVIRSKSTDPGWQAGDIRDELRRRGLFTNPKHIFLIFGRVGRDRTAPGTKEAIRERYTARKIKVEVITPDTLFTEINRGLVSRMHDCRAILAICTPDDRVKSDKETYSQPPRTSCTRSASRWGWRAAPTGWPSCRSTGRRRTNRRGCRATSAGSCPCGSRTPSTRWSISSTPGSANSVSI